jgi:hypothetical protein
MEEEILSAFCYGPRNGRSSGRKGKVYSPSAESLNRPK